MVLEATDLNTFYGLSHILFDVSLKAEKGETVCLLGRNGAGKTTTLRSIIGLTPPRTGSVKVHGRDVTGWSTHKISRLGVGFVPEDRRIFPQHTVLENLQVAERGPTTNGGHAWDTARVYRFFPKLETLQHRTGGSLSGGEQQMLTIARTLMGNPDVVLIDEPSEGLAPAIVDTLADQMMELKKEGVTILLSEQNFEFAMYLADRAYIIERGRIQWQGTPDELRAHDDVRQRYLAV